MYNVNLLAVNFRINWIFIFRIKFLSTISFVIGTQVLHLLRISFTFTAGFCVVKLFLLDVWYLCAPVFILKLRDFRPYQTRLVILCVFEEISNRHFASELGSLWQASNLWLISIDSLDLLHTSAGSIELYDVFSIRNVSGSAVFFLSVKKSSIFSATIIAIFSWNSCFLTVCLEYHENLYLYP